MTIDAHQKNTLIQTAIKAREAAYAPYTDFYVGAALLAESGKIYTGVNIENAALSPTICAERTAFAKAISEGERKFSAIAVCGHKDSEPYSFAYPCGVCRQTMSEFCDPATFKIFVVATSGDCKEHTLAQILPYGFGL